METKLYGKAAYDADIASRPTYHDGTPRKPWEDLCPVARQSWNKKDKTNPMTKKQELEIITEAASRLGPDSYLGPWLTQLLPELEQAMRSDTIPQITIADSVRVAESAAEVAGEILIREAEERVRRIQWAGERIAAASRGMLELMRDMLKFQEQQTEKMRSCVHMMENQVR